MTLKDAISFLDKWDRNGRYVFSKANLAMIFHADAQKSFDEGLRRMVASGVLTRAARGVYVNARARSFSPTQVIERVAAALREGHYNYVSLESILSEYGLISQIPIDRITVMTTGRRGIYATPYGTIEFTHTSRAPEELLESTVRSDARPLRFATAVAALRDLKRVGRNVNMLVQEAA